MEKGRRSQVAHHKQSVRGSSHPHFQIVSALTITTFLLSILILLVYERGVSLYPVFRIRIRIKKGRPDPDPHRKMRIRTVPEVFRIRLMIDSVPKHCVVPRPLGQHSC